MVLNAVAAQRVSLAYVLVDWAVDDEGWVTAKILFGQERTDTSARGGSRKLRAC